MGLLLSLNRMLSLGLSDALETMISHPSAPQKMPPDFVAAGNPGKSLPVSNFDYSLPPTIDFFGKKYCTDKALTLTVSGSSMSPDNVLNGDKIVVYPLSGVDEIQQGDYIVIEVDDKYYKHKHGEEPVFQYKLRRALMPVPQGKDAAETESLLLKKLSEIYEELLLDEYNKDLKEDLRDALQFYNNAPLFASITYKDGVIHYSFHSQEAIKYRVIQIARKYFRDISVIQPERVLY